MELPPDRDTVPPLEGPAAFPAASFKEPPPARDDAPGLIEIVPEVNSESPVARFTGPEPAAPRVVPVVRSRYPLWPLVESAVLIEIEPLFAPNLANPVVNFYVTSIAIAGRS